MSNEYIPLHSATPTSPVPRVSRKPTDQREAVRAAAGRTSPRSTDLYSFTTEELFATTLQPTYPGQHNRLSSHPRHITTASKATPTFFHLNLKGTTDRLFSLTSVSWVLFTPFSISRPMWSNAVICMNDLSFMMIQVPSKSQTDLLVS